ncbi:MAG: DNA polymerase domain-containing protein, partial [Candidatus Eremiobacterota bacterium]
IAKQCGKSVGHPESPQLFLPDPIHQYLLDSGRTFYRGIPFEGLKRLQIHLETDLGEGYELSSPGRDSILAIMLSEPEGWEAVLTLDEHTEDELLERFVALVRQRDPDILEGHNLFKFVLPYLHQRSKLLEVPLNLGRDGAPARYQISRMFIAERTVDYPRWEIRGRDLLDSWILTQLYDVSERELPSYDLVEVARHLGVAGDLPARWLTPRERASLFHVRPEQVLEQARLESRLLRETTRVLSYPYFLQTQIFPYGFENVILRGNATRINALFLREYLRQRTSMPARPAVREFAGGLTAQEYQGVARNVLHCDVQSLYPSLMMEYDLTPRGDTLGVFRGLLRDLRTFRLEARRLHRTTDDEEQRQFYGALQTIFKILINSFYGYLGFPHGNFSDFEQAAAVTAKGRELLTRMIAWLKEQGASILEVDTDGIYFVAPEGADPEDLVERLNGLFPAGLTVELDGRYTAMYCHKMKNYALLDERGELTIRGSGLRSRSLEPYLRGFLEEMLRQVLEGRGDRVPELYRETIRSLEDRSMPVERLARTETLSESPEAYRKKTGAGSRNRAAAYELALAADRGYVAGDSVTYYITGEKASVTAYNNARRLVEYDPARPDWNVAYYRKKLEELYRKFGPLLRVTCS